MEATQQSLAQARGRRWPARIRSDDSPAGAGRFLGSSPSGPDEGRPSWPGTTPQPGGQQWGNQPSPDQSWPPQQGGAAGWPPAGGQPGGESWGQPAGQPGGEGWGQQPGQPGGDQGWGQPGGPPSGDQGWGQQGGWPQQPGYPGAAGTGPYQGGNSPYPGTAPYQQGTPAGYQNPPAGYPAAGGWQQGGPPPQRRRTNPVLIIVPLAVVAAIVLGVVIALAVGGGDDKDQVAAPPLAGPTSVPLPGATVPPPTLNAPPPGGPAPIGVDNCVPVTPQGAPAAGVATIGGSGTVVGEANSSVSDFEAKVTLNSVCSTTGEVTDYGDPPVQGAYYVINVTVEVSRGDTSASPSDFYIQTPDGTRYDGSYDNVAPRLSASDVKVGQKVRGNIVIDAPPGHGVLNWEPLFAVDTAKFQL